MGRSKSSHRWLKEHFDDPWVKRAQAGGWRSRAVFKLQELDERHRLLRPGMTVVDLGAAPGGWSQYAAHALRSKGRILALDILPMDAIADVEFIQGDFREEEVLNRLLAALGDARADLVMSDMAPNISGVASLDQPRAMYLAELALLLAADVLKPGGTFLVKLFQGEGFDDYVRELRSRFGKVSFRKPRASRPRSREVYALATGFEM